MDDELVEVECPMCGRARMGLDPTKWTAAPACGSCRGRAKESDQTDNIGLKDPIYHFIVLTVPP